MRLPLLPAIAMLRKSRVMRMLAKPPVCGAGPSDSTSVLELPAAGGPCAAPRCAMLAAIRVKSAKRKRLDLTARAVGRIWFLLAGSGEHGAETRAALGSAALGDVRCVRPSRPSRIHGMLFRERAFSDAPLANGIRGSDDPVADRLGHGTATRAHVQLGVDVPDVRIDRVWAQREQARDLFL